MSAHPSERPGQDGPRRDRSPDVADQVMRRLGYERVESPVQARRLRIRRRTLLAAQAVLALAACGLGVTWWWSTRPAERPVVAMGDALRGSIVQGAGRLDGLFAAMPRAPMTSTLSAATDASPTELPRVEPAPLPRSY